MGFRNRTRTRNSNRECENIPSKLEQTEKCFFPCTGSPPLAPDQIPFLIKQLQKPIQFWGQNQPEFLPRLLSSLFPTQNISVIVPASQETLRDQASEMDIYLLRIAILNPSHHEIEADVFEKVGKVCNFILGPDS